MYHDLPRCTPEQAGIRSGLIQTWLDALEATGTEMHGVMVARCGKVCAEGWWAPYAPQLAHGLQSLTKTYTVTALGLLYDEGKLSLDEKLTDIFPEYMPAEISDNLREVTVCHLLSMGTGICRMSSFADEDWIKQFFALPVVNKPGSAFFYSGICSAVGGAIIRKRTGMGLIAYMTPRLFDIIGIDAQRIKSIHTGDGLEYGGGGFFTTTEDNLRLMMLYLNRGMWEGKRVLSEAWCHEVTTKQIETATESINNPGVDDNYVGYGLQCWMCIPDGVYRADGSMGQFSIVVPRLQLVVSINEMADQRKLQHQRVLDTVWNVLLPGIQAYGLPKDTVAYEALRRRLSMLTVPRPVYALRENRVEAINHKRWRMEDNAIILLPGTTFLTQGEEAAGIDHMTFHFHTKDDATLCWSQHGADMEITIGTNGSYRLNQGRYSAVGLEWLYAIGGWTTPDTFEIVLRMVETCFSHTVTFTFGKDCVSLHLAGAVTHPGRSAEDMSVTGRLE